VWIPLFIILTLLPLSPPLPPSLPAPLPSCLPSFQSSPSRLRFSASKNGRCPPDSFPLPPSLPLSLPPSLLPPPTLSPPLRRGLGRKRHKGQKKGAKEGGRDGGREGWMPSHLYNSPWKKHVGSRYVSLLYAFPIAFFLFFSPVNFLSSL
jgi:hypothetical protein